MLSELRTVAREMQKAGAELEIRHPDIKDARRIPTALVRLRPDGSLDSVYILTPDTRCWTLRDGQHNSFPFVQFRAGLLSPVDEADGVHRRDVAERRAWFLAYTRSLAIAPALGDWPGKGLLERLRERRMQLSSLDGRAGAAAFDTIDRFLSATVSPRGGAMLLHAIAKAVAREVEQSGDPATLDVGERLLIRGDAALMFDTSGASSILDVETIRSVSAALGARTSNADGDVHTLSVCGLTGARAPLVEGPFPQPNLPQIGQTFVFARNRDIPANSRYGRSAAASMPVGVDAANEIAAAITAITEPRRRNITWRPVPSEMPGSTDLLLAFAEGDLDAPVAASLAGDDADDDFDDRPDTVATFEIRAQRVVDTIRAHVGSDFETTRLHVLIFRQVDPANRKVIYDGRPTVRELKRAAEEWSAAASSLPAWLALPVRRLGTRHPEDMAPRVFPPLGLVAMSRPIFLMGGRRSMDAPGLPAAEALRLFLDSAAGDRRSDASLVRRVLHLFLTRRAQLLVHVARERWRANGARARDALNADLSIEALRTATVFGVLLTKLNRAETYMDDSPFKLGQLLAAADGVHAGYCADVRGGDLPPSLMGNQMLTMAQATPTKALAVLSSRWKPYKAWADRLDIGIGKRKFAGWTREEDPDYRWRGWAIRNGVEYNRAMRTLAAELQARTLTDTPDDAFRAELLLGYLSGVPLGRKSGATPSRTNDTSSTGDE